MYCYHVDSAMAWGALLPDVSQHCVVLLDVRHEQAEVGRAAGSQRLVASQDAVRQRVGLHSPRPRGGLGLRRRPGRQGAGLALAAREVLSRSRSAVIWASVGHTCGGQ